MFRYTQILFLSTYYASRTSLYLNIIDNRHSLLVILFISEEKYIIQRMNLIAVFSFQYIKRPLTHVESCTLYAGF